MKNLTKVVTVAAILGASAAAQAWYGYPVAPHYGFAPTALTEEQKQAIADQQKAMVEQQQAFMQQQAQLARDAWASEVAVQQEQFRMMHEVPFERTYAVPPRFRMSEERAKRYEERARLRADSWADMYKPPYQVQAEMMKEANERQLEAMKEMRVRRAESLNRTRTFEPRRPVSTGS